MPTSSSSTSGSTSDSTTAAATAAATAPATSSFQKTVSLHDWWLIKAEKKLQGKRIAVAGLTSPEKIPVRVFHSAAITKRHDVFTVETADGFTVIIQGYINRKLTVENGFSSQVLRHFCFGFPPDWEECATKLMNTNCENEAEPPVSQKECHPSFSAMPVEDGVNNLKNVASKNLPPLSSCHINAVSWTKDSMVIPAEPSSHHLALSSGKIDVLEGSKKSKMRSFGKSMAKRSASLERIGIKNDASGEYSVCGDSNASAAYSVHTDNDEDSIATSTVDQTPSVGTSVAVLAMNSKELKSAKENEGNKDSLESRSNFSTRFFTPGPQAMVGCIDDDTTEGPTPGDSNNLNQSANCLVGTSMFSSMQSGISPSMVETDTMNANLSDSGRRKSTTSLTNMITIQIQKSVSGNSVKDKAKELISDEGKLKRNSGRTLRSSGKVDIAEAMLRASRPWKELSGNSRSKEKIETIAVEKGGSSTKQARRKGVFDADIRKVKTFIRSSESLSLKRSRSGRLLLPALDFWRNQIPVYDETLHGEHDENALVVLVCIRFDSAVLIYDTVIHIAHILEHCISGKHAEFVELLQVGFAWPNNRNITGVQEELGAVEPSRGIESKTQKSKGKSA
ncbi:unnamed protein product [Dovyalis caffra]|uniref:SANTA domain-containing protein n=1 Tax=Dovyalis caffra TaxID=77055 RepID=A0AAV1RQ87_9ROSI|nr:unnamed protein product [Dovyalis caffra]